MPNDRLRDVLLSKGLTPEDVAERLAVDPKTVERWITRGRIPYPRHRHAIAAMAGEAETYLWPGAVPVQRSAEVAQSEIVRVYPLPRTGLVPAGSLSPDTGQRGRRDGGSAVR